jgi:hypothetical protein
VFCGSYPHHYPTVPARPHPRTRRNCGWHCFCTWKCVYGLGEGGGTEAGALLPHFVTAVSPRRTCPPVGVCAHAPSLGAGSYHAHAMFALLPAHCVRCVSARLSLGPSAPRSVCSSGLDTQWALLCGVEGAAGARGQCLIKCGNGKYKCGLTCCNCAGGTSNSDVCAFSCSACAAGQYSGTGAAACTACAAGQYSGNGAAACSACAAGQYSGNGAAACTACPVGTYSAGSVSSCTGCSAGACGKMGSTSLGLPRARCACPAMPPSLARGRAR